MTHRLFAAAFTGIVLTGSCAGGATEVEPIQDLTVIRSTSAIVLRDVHVIPMTTEVRLDNQTVVVGDGRIESRRGRRRPLGSSDPIRVIGVLRC